LQGNTLRETGAILGVSYQRIQQHMAATAVKWNIFKENENGF
jgi:hypothetical protein